MCQASGNSGQVKGRLIPTQEASEKKKELVDELIDLEIDAAYKILDTNALPTTSTLNFFDLTFDKISEQSRHFISTQIDLNKFTINKTSVSDNT